MAARRRTTAWLAAIAVAVSLVAPVASASAKPVKPAPSAKAVRQARAAAHAAARAVAAAAAAQASAQARLATLDAALETAIEKWDAAKAQAADAAAVLATKKLESQAAAASSTYAQASVDRLAASSYQVGAELAAMIDSAMSADGLSGLVSRMTDVTDVAAANRRSLRTASDAHLAAAQAEAAAMRAAADLAAQQALAAKAEKAVLAQEAAQKAEVTRLSAVVRTATATLAKAKATATLLAHQRAQALAMAAAAARAAAQASQHSRGTVGRPAPEGGSARWPLGQSVTTAAQRLAALNWARTQIGKPYIAGHNGPEAYDCSGLTQWAFDKVGHHMIQFSQTQFAAGAKIPYSQLQPGDLVFFGTDPHDWHSIHHVAIYAGHDTMVEAPHTGGHVQEVGIWWAQLMPFGARP
jgi:cell wall-associated NlpC family hydrolase